MTEETGGCKRPLLRIGTHSGSFHCDEALGCYLLRKTPAYSHAEIVRSRNPDVLRDLDVVIDVGGVYDPATHRYDHHQREFQEVFGHGFATRLSSAGLVYKHFGRGIVAAHLNESEESAQTEAVWLAVYRTFMEAIDAVDNGVNQWDGDAPPKYVDDTHLSARVGRLNPEWNAADQSEAELYRRFLQAVDLAGSEFDSALRRTAQVWLPARQLVLADLSSRKGVDPSGAVVVLSTFCPWKEHLHQLEQELGCPGQVLYALYQDEREGSWRVQAVAQAPGSFASRKALPAPWRGLRDEALSEAAGVPDLVFVHASGFIGGGKTKEAALTLARKAVAA